MPASKPVLFLEKEFSFRIFEGYGISFRPRTEQSFKNTEPPKAMQHPCLLYLIFAPLSAAPGCQQGCSDFEHRAALQ